MSVQCGQDNEDLDESSDSSDSDFLPSISDRLCVGYGTMDHACQTNISEIMNIKEVSSVLGFLLKDVNSLQKNLYFAKTSLKAEYDHKLEQAVLSLYKSLNQNITDIELKHQEQIDIVRRCYRTQLSNAICKLSRDYHYFYGNKDAAAESSHKKKLKEMEKQQETARRNEIAQREMYQMMKIQMEDASNKIEEIPSRKSSVVSLSVFTDEIEELKGVIKEIESRAEYLEDMLEETNKDNTNLNLEISELNLKCQKEHDKVISFAKEIKSLKEQLEKERIEADDKLKALSLKHEEEMKNEISKTKNSMQDEARKKLDDMKRIEAEKLNRQKYLEQQRIKQLEEQHEKNKVVVEVPVDTDLSRLQAIERKQRIEIARLQKQMEQSIKMYEMKVRILTEHIHTLKDEMFLRKTLRRQSAQVKHAALTYVKRGSILTPLGILPTEDSVISQQNSQQTSQQSKEPLSEQDFISRKYQLPNIIQPPKMIQAKQSLKSNAVSYMTAQ